MIYIFYIMLYLIFTCDYDQCNNINVTNNTLFNEIIK